MARLRWTPQALDDIEAICKFIARDSDHFAHLFANKVFEKAKTLEAFPNSGRIVPESNQETIREIFHGSYRIIYRIREDEIEVLTVHHSARLFDVSMIEII
jgi:addiction module RelE/StbE family toxin